MKTKMVLFMCISLIFTSCELVDFSEKGCVYQGILSATCGWEHLSEEQKEPVYSDMHLVYYPAKGEAFNIAPGSSEQFDAPVINRVLYVGSYDLLAFNKGDNRVKGLDETHGYGEIYAPTKEIGNRVYIDNEQQFVYSALQTDVKIYTDDTTHVRFTPRSLVQQIKFNIVVKGLENLPPIVELRAELDGVTTSRWLATGKKGIGYATKAFTFDPTERPDYFTYSFLVFGINDTPENNLRLIADFGDGIIGRGEVELDDVLNNFESDKIDITLEMDISPSLYITARIIDWIDNDYGSIVIQ